MSNDQVCLLCNVVHPVQMIRGIIPMVVCPKVPPNMYFMWDDEKVTKIMKDNGLISDLCCICGLNTLTSVDERNPVCSPDCKTTLEVLRSHQPEEQGSYLNVEYIHELDKLRRQLTTILEKPC